MADELLEDLKFFVENAESQKLSKNEVSTNFISIQKKYCGDNFCDVDSETRMKADDFVEYIKKRLIDLKQTTKGGKKRKTKRHYKKIKTRKNQKGGIVDVLIEATLTGVVFAFQLTIALLVMKAIGQKADPIAMGAAFW
jgi:hypothetical protein